MSIWETETLGRLLKSRFRVPFTDDPFAALLEQLDDIPSKKEYDNDQPSR